MKQQEIESFKRARSCPNMYDVYIYIQALRPSPTTAAGRVETQFGVGFKHKNGLARL
jgi:hypothetical protein